MAHSELVQSKNGLNQRSEPVQDQVVEVPPPVDIFENEEELLLIADLPGVERDALKISLDAPELRIEGQRPEAGDGSPRVLYSRTFRVDDRIDPDGISAELVQGVLRVHLKKAATLRPRRIEVRSA